MTVIAPLLDYINYHNKNLLWKLRQLDSNTLSLIDRCDIIGNHIRKLCSFDTDVYDQHYYNRIQTKNEILPSLNRYHDLRMITVIDCYDELFECDDIEVKKIPLPIEFRKFIYYYTISPNMKYVMLNSSVMYEILSMHSTDLNTKIINDDIADSVYFIPLCYVKQRNDKSAIVLCYANIIKAELQFPDVNERFITFEFSISSADDKQTIPHIIRRVLFEESAIYKNKSNHNKLADSLSSFIDCLDKLA